MDKRLKQRLIGATVLAALAVIIVPELIKEPAEQRQPVVSTEMPARPQEPESPSMTISLPGSRPPEFVAEEGSRAPQEPYSLDQPDPPPSNRTAQPETTRSTPPTATREPPQPTGAAIAPRQPIEPPKSASPPTSRSAESSPPEKSADTDTPEMQASRPSQKLPEIDLIARSTGAGYTPSESSPSAAPSASTASSQVSPQPAQRAGWMVQVGSFSVADNAYQLRDRLRSRQFPVSVERAVVNGRALHRVYVGPQTSRAASETVLERVRRETGIDGQVVFLDN